MNHFINSVLGRIPRVVQVGIVIVVGLSLGLFIWYKATQIWNGVGNMYFAAKMSWQGRDAKKELESAAVQRKEIDKTLTELAIANKELQSVKAEKDRLEKIFNDQSKTAAEKVAEFKKAVANDPEHSPTDNITTEDLCARAKAIGSSAATIAALCGQ